MKNRTVLNVDHVPDSSSLNLVNGYDFYFELNRDSVNQQACALGIVRETTCLFI